MTNNKMGGKISNLFVVLSLFAMFFLIVKRADAAGTFFCRWNYAEQKCEVSQDNCGANQKADCAQYTSFGPATCQDGEKAACVVDTGTPPPGNSCSPGACTTTADCASTQCVNPSGASCGGTCKCQLNKCNNSTDCEELTACLGATSGNWCSGTCSLGGGGSTTDETTGFAGTCTNNATGIDTAIGCVPLNSLNLFATFFFRWGLGIAGGVGFLFLIYSSFIIMTSAGDPTKLQNGKDLLISTISGIALLIFSVFILRLIGVNLLGLFG